VSADVIRCRHCGQTIAVPPQLTDVQAWRWAADWFANHFCDHRLDVSASSAPPAQPPALGDETGAGGTAPVDQPARNTNRGGRP
jgi:hypothetical protein